MKNYFKHQVKKSLSLLMAVLMLMTCWVWVAPDKAEAGAPTSYDVVVTTGSDDDCPNACEDTHRIVFTFADGTTSEKNWANAANGATGDETFTLNKWPKSIYFQVGSKNIANARITRVTINGVEIFSGGYNLKATGGVLWETKKDWTMEAGGTQAGQKADWTAPAYANSVTTLTGAAHTLDRINSGNSVTSTISIGSITDQYGVNYSGSVSFSATLRADGEVTLGQNASITTSGNSRTITIKPWFQTLYPGKQGAKLYIDWSVNNGTKSGTETINITFPTYKATFHANGGKIGADDSEAKDTIEYTGEKMNIGSVIGKAPAYATKPGFEFKGFYSTQNADATGKTASFSGTKFKDNETTIPAASSGNGDTNWYAAWQALPITATFMTADNQLIGTVEGRYNNYMTASNMYNGDAGLNAAVKASHTAGKVKFDSNDTPVYTDGSTTYTFAGWKIIKAYDESVVDGNEDTVLKGDVTFQAVYTKADAKTYTVTFEDGNGNTMITQSGKKYRDLITGITYEPTKATDDKYNYEFIGWAKDIGKNAYVVDETDRDENGATIVYTHKGGAEFIVKGDASYVPVFRMIPREYTVTYKYNVDGAVQQTTLIEGYHWHDGVKMPEIKDNYTNGGFRYYIDGWTVGNSTQVKQLDEITVEGDMTLTAHYGAGQAAEYTINFYGKDTDGVTDVLLNGDNNIYAHNTTVTVPEVETTIDTEDSVYTFAGWSPSIKTTATGDADYYATYTKKDYADLHFYNYDGTLIYELDGKENSLFVGDTIPAYENLVDGENVLPEKPEDVVGTYNFTGWADGNGNEVVPGTDRFTADTYLTAQFNTNYKEYTVTFLNDEVDDEGNKVVISQVKYHYGTEITVPADPTKAPDVEYIYDFRGWTPDVSEVCYGDATYTATYRRTPQYYKVTWLNDKKAVHTESNYQYNAKIQQAVINAPVGYEAAGEGKTWAFKHWVQCDAYGNAILDDGEQVIFVRGQRIGAEHLYFYPVFEKVANVLTVKFFKEDGTTLLGEAKIPYGDNIADYAGAFAEKAPKAADAVNHYVINNWVNVNGGGAVTTITADVSVKATYTTVPHTKDVYDIIIEPTCTETGLADISCSAAECDYTFRNVVLDVIPDEGAPTGQFYVGTDKWTLADFLAGIDYSDVKYVGPDTNVIVNAWDNGSRSKQNPDGILNRGVGKIDYYVSETVVADPASIGTWTNVYDFEATKNSVLNKVLEANGKTMQDYIAMSTPNNDDKKAIDDEVKAILATYNANATGILSNLELDNGTEYIIYIRISDREVNGESNKCYLSSGKLHYGSTPATVAVSGDGYGTKFCAEATVDVTDDTAGFKVYVDGEELTVTLSEDGKKATFVYGEKGVHTVTVIDKNGNKTIKTFEIKGNHTYRNYITAATCDNAGSTYDLCTVCGVKANETVIPALGHSYTANFVDKAADCINDGYRTYICDNNCGTKLILKPTDDAATVAKAKKWDETAGENGEWVDLEVADLEDLKATGAHTYAKVKDENGEDTTEDAWVVDKAATCTVAGSKHRDCTVCGIIGRETAEIPVDTENGHKFYREKVTTEPTCTTKGEKTKTCRYCGEVVHVADIDALGHTAGEYRVILEPTCTAKGSKILTCAVCNVDIGEPVKDKEGEFDGKAVEIPALGHKMKLEGDVYSVEEEGVTVWYQDYKCSVCGYVESKKLDDYKPPVAATVTFDFNGGYYTIPAVGTPDQIGYVPEMLKGTQTISTFVGETIVAADVEKAFKLNDDTKVYSFSHWENADGEEVKFPIEVTGDATYYAVYTEKYINYTITYYKEDGTTEFKKTGYLHNGEEVELANGPAKAATSLVSYKFAGWVVIGSEPEVVYTDKITIDGANINLKAKYTEVKKQYAVTYAYSKSDILETFAVEAGQPARDCAIEPVKKADSKYHYEFKAWNKAAQLVSVESNIYTTPDFEAKSHEYIVTVKTPATCGVNRVDTYTCSVCGYTYDEEVSNSAREHNWGEPVYDATTGKNTVTCQYDDCGVTEQDTRTFTAKFYVEATDTQAIQTVSYIAWGTKIDSTRLPADPTKESTSSTDYTFKGWAVKGDTTNTIIKFATYEVKDDVDFVAVFEGTTRKYNVIFGYDANHIIKAFTDVPAGDDVTLELAKAPEKAYDDTYHYTFKGWKGYTEGVLNITVEDVQEDLRIYAEFTKTKHNYEHESELKEATCQNGAGTRYSCDCGAYYDVTGKPLDHNWVEIDRVEATANKDGYIKYECTSCKETKEEPLTWVSDKLFLEVKVLRNGEAQANVQVQFVEKNSAGAVIPATTGLDGVARVQATKSSDGYDCYVNIDGEMVLVTDFAEGANGNYIGTYSYTVADVDCSCACHRDNIWGAIFRFFHKIIKFFTGEFKCCGNPDPMYG